MGRPGGKRCPTPEKGRFRTRGEALRAVDRIVKDNAQAVAPLPFAPQRAYRCACGVWHLTRMEA